MYNLLIVDDEKIIADAICEVLSQELYGEADIYKAYDASEALRVFERIRVDVAMIDVKMPGMSGLELLDTIKRTWSYCHAIMLTGHDEFDYIYTAVQHPNTKYILKSDGFPVVMETVKKTVAQLEAERSAMDIARQAQEQLERASEALKRDLFHSLGMGMVSDTELDDLAMGIDLNVDIASPFSLIACKRAVGEKSGYIEQCRLNRKIANIIGIHLTSVCRYEYTLDDQGYILFYVQPLDDGIDAAKFNSAVRGNLELAQDNIRDALEAHVSMVIKNGVTQWHKLREAANRCLLLLSTHYGAADGMFIIEANEGDGLAPQPTGIPELDGMAGTRAMPRAEQQRETIMSSLLSGNRQECLDAIRSLKKLVSDGLSMHSFEAQEIYLTAALPLLSYINRFLMIPALAFETGLYRLTKTDSFESWHEAFSFLEELCGKVFTLRSKDGETQAQRLIDMIQDHIQENIFFPDKITLMSISSMVHFNPSYLSRLFKQYTGTNISEYIMEYKVKTAKSLLLSPNMKIQDISDKLGYTSANNFARYFRRFVGLSPVEYRTQTLMSK